MNADTENKKARLIERRKDQILTAARQIFAQNGFRRTKIDQIADALSVGKGTIYRYFEDKKALFLAVFEQGMGELRQAFFTNVVPITNPRRKIAAAVKTYFSFFDNNRDLIEIMMQVRSEFKEQYRQAFVASYEDYIVRIQENLRKGIEMGVFRQLDVERTAEAISATLQGVLQSFYIRELELNQDSGIQKESLVDRVETVTELLLSGLLKG